MIRRKRIWITGASSGIGKALALKLAAMSNRVVVSGRNIDSLDRVVAESRASIPDSDMSALVCDVTKDGLAEVTAAALRRELGGLDIVIICAGHCEYVDDAAVDVEMFRRVYDVNVFGAVNTLMAALPLLKETGDNPQIVAVASLSAVVGLPRAEAYGSSKAAMNYLFDSLRLGLHRDDISVTVVNPGFVETPMTQQNDFPMPFLMQPDQAVDCMIRGIERRKRHVKFPLRLWASLKLAALVPPLWYSVIGPRLARRDNKTG